MPKTLKKTLELVFECAIRDRQTLIECYVDNLGKIIDANAVSEIENDIAEINKLRELLLSDSRPTVNKIRQRITTTK